MKRVGNLCFAVANLADALDLAAIAERMTRAGERAYRRATR
jgi:hypothetical protein